MIKEQSGFYWVETDDNQVFICELRGRLKEEAQSSDIVAIGDRVTFTPRIEDGTQDQRGVIESVAERHSVLSRAVRTQGKRGGGQAEREHVIVANPDQAFFVFAVQQPTPNYRMLDYLLAAAEAAEIPEIIILANKIDLSTPEQSQATFVNYVDIGYEVICTSAMQPVGIDIIKKRLANKISFFAGPSGVGKTSLLNQLQPNLGRQVKQVSAVTQEGVHTTRDSALIKLESGGYLADTPGIRSMSLWDVEPDELDAYFIEIADYVDQCRFGNCTHSSEPGCAVLAAVENGQISQRRYENYVFIRDQLKDSYVIYNL